LNKETRKVNTVCLLTGNPFKAETCALSGFFIFNIVKSNLILLTPSLKPMPLVIVHANLGEQPTDLGVKLAMLY